MIDVEVVGLLRGTPRQLFTKENCPTINQTVTKPMAIKELMLSNGMDLSSQNYQKIFPPWENYKIIHACSLST